MPERVIFGIDIAKASPRSKETPKYAVVILRDDKVEHHKMVSQQKFLRMAWKEKPSFIAVDNIFELASDKHHLVSILQKLPVNTKVVQVTSDNESLTKLARQHGLSFEKFDPNAEALVCAKLVEMGIGYEVSAFEDRTIIKVSRGRSLGKGGWSQNRYRRKVHGHVRQKAREIEEYLNEQSKLHGFTYTQKVVERFGGYSKAEFFVDISRSQLHIPSGKYGDVQVRVKSIERDVLDFKPLKAKKRDYIIVGVDPGTTIAVAVLGLEGELRMLHSSRTASISDIIEMIAQQGRPLIVASDVYPIPHTVEKIRRSFNAVLSSPDDMITSEDKIELAKPYEYSNTHERDAIAAAVFAYRKNRNKFEQIKKKIPPGVEVNEVIAQVVRGKSMDAVISELTKKETKHESFVSKKKTETHYKIKRYENSIHEMKEYIKELKNELFMKERRIMELERRIERMHSEEYKQLKKEKGIRIRDKEIERLHRQLSEKDKHLRYLTKRIEKLKQVRRLEISGKVLPVKIISTFTKDCILKTREEVGIRKDDIVLLRDASGGGTMTSRMLADMGVRVVIICNEMSHVAEEELFNLNIPVLNVKDVNLQFDPLEGFAVIHPDEIQHAIHEWKKKAEKRRIAAKEEWLESLVEKYRSERRREKIK